MIRIFFLSETFRVLKKNGLLYITTPNLASLPNRIRLLFGKYPLFVPEYRVGGAGHIRSYTLPVLKKQLKEHGFIIEKTAAPNITFPMNNKYFPSFLKKIAFFLGDYYASLGSHIVIQARK